MILHKKIIHDVFFNKYLLCKLFIFVCYNNLFIISIFYVNNFINEHYLVK